MNANDEDFFVIRPVEDGDSASFRGSPSRSPEKVVQPFLFGWCLETEYVDSLGIDAGHHVLDGAVLARRVEGLKNNDDRILLARPQQLLSLGQAGHILE